MPYSRYTSGPEDYYQQGSNFDPYTGRLNGGNMVLEFLARVAGQKEQKQKDQWAIQDRSSEMDMRKLQQTQAEQGIAMNQRKIQDYQPPVSPAAQFAMDRLGAVAAEQRRLREIAAQGEENRKTWETRSKVANKTFGTASVAMRKQYLSAKEKIETDFTAQSKAIESQYASQIAAIRKDKNLTTINESTGPNPYMIALNGARASMKRMKKELEARRAQQIEVLEKDYATGASSLSSVNELSQTIPEDVLAAAREARPDLSDEEIIQSWRAKK
jgi:hypothetical protein